MESSEFNGANFCWPNVVYNKNWSNSLSNEDEHILEKDAHEIHDNWVTTNVYDSTLFKILPGVAGHQ